MTASFEKGPYKVAEIAQKFDSKVSGLSPIRASQKV